MLKDCLEIFNEEMKRAKEKTGEEERLILDRYSGGWRLPHCRSEWRNSFSYSSKTG